MPDTMNEKVFTVIATTASRLPDLAIGDKQLIFIHDKCKIAFDLHGKRKFYNQIETLETDADRQTIEPIEGGFYFVLGTSVLWNYSNSKWVSLTSSPQQVLFIGTALPELGSELILYVNTEQSTISVWDTATQSYIVVADKSNVLYEEMTQEDIDNMFV